MLQDIRYGFRSLLKSPAFTAAAAMTLALGIGANTAIFTVVNGVLLQPLPYEESERLVDILETKLPQYPAFSVAPGNFTAWAEGNTSVEEMAAYRLRSYSLTGRGEPERLDGVAMSAGLFTMLGARPAHGRGFLPEEDQPGRDVVVIVSHGLWQRRFGGSPELIGQKLTLSARIYTVVGIMPPDFYFPRPVSEFWVPLALTAEDRENHGSHGLRVVARLKKDVAIEQAHTELSTVAQRLEQEFPGTNAGWGVFVRPMLDAVVGDTRPALMILVAATGFVLLIACANVANMLLARATGRQKEIAVRGALGAARFRIVRQLLTESMILGVAGGSAGLLLAMWGVKLLPELAPGLPRIDDVALDGYAFGFVGVLALVTSMVFGQAPALQASRSDLTESLKEGGRGASGNRRRRRMRSFLVVVEIALALVLLIGAGLLIRTFWELQQVDPGFNPEKALAVTIDLPESKYEQDHERIAFFGQLVDRLSVLPGVEAVGATAALPFLNDSIYGFWVDGRPEPSPGEMSSTNYYAVSSGYFEAMEIPLLRGRLFTDRDRQKTPPVAVINETMARRFFPDEDPIGRGIQLTDGTLAFSEIVGIVGDVKQNGLDTNAPVQTYRPFLQRPSESMTVVLRGEGNLEGLAVAVRRKVSAGDKDQPVSQVSTLVQLLSFSVARARASMRLLLIFGGIALLLAAVGIYGVVAYAVAQRTREFGIRMAFGATTGAVLRLVFRQGVMLALVGVVVGMAASVAVTHAMTSLLFGVTATDPITFTFVPLMLVIVASIASYVPARRATRVDPLTALRQD